MLLLVAVSLFCGIFAVGISLMESTPSVAADAEAKVATYRQPVDDKPVRVIVPFTPNTNPGTR